ncbi:hypothetical protein K7G98_38825, partial [Saccharothrix sp. MB29]|nr:hypothetical protein [Saccharothrix sp. MB29]
YRDPAGGVRLAGHASLELGGAVAGGIAVTVGATREASDADLLANLHKHVAEAAHRAYGTTASSIVPATRDT